MPTEANEREAAHMAAWQAIYGPGADPFHNPEAFDFCVQVANAVLASIPGASNDAEYVLVPRVPTEAMLKAGARGRQNSARSSFADGWKFALAAYEAASPQVQADEDTPRRQALRRMVAMDEAAGLYDDETVAQVQAEPAKGALDD